MITTRRPAPRAKPRSLLAALLGSLAPVAASLAALPAAAQEVNVYTYREAGLIRPLFAAFTKDTGIKVNAVFATEGLEQRIAAEGANSPADVLLTVDVARLQEAKTLGITRSVRSEALESEVPAAFRDPEGYWFGASSRARVIYASKARVPASAMTYEELADPKYKGRVCVRSGQHPYNLALFAAYLAHHGPEATETWLRGLKANLARKPSGGDREVARDIAAGLCDVGLGNTYYHALMTNREADKKPWAEATKVILPTFEGGGTHVNISGVAVTKYAPHAAEAVRLAEWFGSDAAQALYASANYEFPIRAGTALDATVASWGALKPDPLPIKALADRRKEASLLVEKVGFDD